MSKNPSKIADQRVWPYPNFIEKGSDDLIVRGKLTPSCFVGDGKRFVKKSVINEFNDFVFGKKNSLSRMNCFISIKTTNTLSDSKFSERYEIKVTKRKIYIYANNYVGAIWALMTLKQLIRKKGKNYVIENAPMKIVDSPNMEHRSLMIDTSRHFIPKEAILKQIKTMAFNKLNRLHLHLTDAQSFPISLGPATSKIAYGSSSDNPGAFSKKEIYSRRDIKDIVEYAKDRGIVVIPEIDTPGHTFSWGSGFSGIMTCNTEEFQQEATCPEPPCGFLDLEKRITCVRKVVKDVWSEVIAAFRIGAPGYGNYIHIGFDEVGCPNTVDGKCQAPSCAAAYGENSINYANWLLKWLKTNYPETNVIMWVDQILTSNFPDGSYEENIKADKKNVIFQFWNLDKDTPGYLKELADQGYKLINSQATVYYLDAGGDGNSFVYGGPIGVIDDQNKRKIAFEKNWITTYPGVTKSTMPSNGWPISWEELYQNNPTYLTTDIGTDQTGNFVHIPQAKCSHGGIIGVTAPLWSEQVDEVNLDQKLWPRASALAESTWRFNPNRPPDNILNARLRLVFTREDLLRLGVNATPLVPADIFKNAPWGVRNGKTDLMYDINQKKQQIPKGYTLNYKRFWTKDLCTGRPINPFCGSHISHTMQCDNKGAKYVQEGCDYEDSESV